MSVDPWPDPWPLKNIIREAINLHARSLELVLTTLAGPREDLAVRFDNVADPDLLELLEYEASDLNTWLQEMAELQLVATYHWFEKEVKAIAAWLPTKTKADVARLNFPDLKDLYNKHGVIWETQPHYGNVNLLRLLANSWKHNSSDASKDVLNDLGVQREVNHGVSLSTFGLLSYEPIEYAIRQRLGLTSNDITSFDIVREFESRVREFLLGILAQAPLRK